MKNLTAQEEQIIKAYDSAVVEKHYSKKPIPKTVIEEYQTLKNKFKL